MHWKQTLRRAIPPSNVRLSLQRVNYLPAWHHVKLGEHKQFSRSLERLFSNARREDADIGFPRVGSRGSEDTAPGSTQGFEPEFLIPGRNSWQPLDRLQRCKSRSLQCLVPPSE